MNVLNFINNSGFKSLALLKLEGAEYSTLLYLMNTAISGLEQIITNSHELSEIIDYPELEITDALFKLSDMNIIHIKYADATTTTKENPSMRISMVFDADKWQIKSLEPASQKAVVYPFRRGVFESISGGKETINQHASENKSESDTWKRVVKYFIQDRSLDDAEITSAEDSAKQLVELHPVDQILLLIKHFGQRIPTLSLLASSWDHFQETFIAEHHNIDLLGARKKHQELDEQLRSSAREKISSRAADFSEEELQILEIFKTHKHPRRQLFWAYQVRAKYPNLQDFFEENRSMMLAVSTSGNIVKR